MINIDGEKMNIRKRGKIEDFFNEMDKVIEEKGIEVKKIDLDVLYEEQLEKRHKFIP